MVRSFTRSATFGVIASLFFAASAAAQSQPQPRQERYDFGTKGGYLGSTFNYDARQELFDGQGSWIAGVFVNSNRRDRLDLQGEINVLKKSTRCGCNRQQVDLYYLQIPGLARINIGERQAGGVRVYGLAGPALELKIGEKLGSHIISEYANVDVSLNAGGGVEFRRMLVETRASWGLRNLGTNLPDGVKITSRAFMILGGFRFK